MDDALIKIGLTQKEAKVYLTALKLGTATAAKIAASAKLNRPTTYAVLERLIELGLISRYDDEKIQLFTAEDPERLQELLDGERRDVEARQKALRQSLHQLKALHQTTGRPRVLVYGSGEAADQAFYNQLVAGEALVSFTNTDLLTSDEKQQASRQRIAGGHHLKVLYTNSHGPLPNATSRADLREARYIPADQFPVTCVITVGVNSGMIYINDSETNTLLLVSSRSIAKTLAAVFNQIWLLSQDSNS